MPENDELDPKSDAVSPAEFAAGRPRVREAVTTDRAEIARAIGRAFFDDPIAVHLFPDIETRRPAFGAFAELAMDQFRGSGATFVTDPVKGAAIWQAPNPPRLQVWRMIAMAFRLYRIAGRGYRRAIRLAEAIEKHHLREPHWYLAILGADPDFQGRGLGTALMQPILARCDVEAIPAYLESSKESNIPFYQRHGFDVGHEVRIPDGPMIWTMIRRPR